MKRWNLEIPERFDRWADAGAFNEALSRRGGRILSHATLNGHHWLNIELPQSVDPMQLPGVLLAEPDEPIFPVASTISPLAIDPARSWAPLHVGVDKVHGATKGEGIRIAVLDSGLTIASPEFNGANISVMESIVPGADPTVDDLDHGTVVTSVMCAQGVSLLGIAPRSEYIILKTLGGGSTSSVAAAAINRARELGANVINMSFVGVFSTMTEDALAAFVNSGGIAVAAAGNGGAEIGHVVRYPASSPLTIAVGSVDSSNQIAQSSSWGEWPLSPDVVAPGVGVVGVSRTGVYRFASGTSLASPIVAGCFALALSHRPDDWRMNGLVLDPKYGLNLPSHIVHARQVLERTSLALSDRNRTGYGLIDAPKLAGVGAGVGAGLILALLAGGALTAFVATRREARR